MGRFYVQSPDMKQDKLIWFAIVFSTFIYAAIVYTLAPNPEGSFGDAVKQQMPMILYGVAAVTFIAALVIPNLLQRSPARVKMIVALALFEACAIYGLMAAMLVKDWRLFVPTWIIALLGMWTKYPSSDVTASAAI